MTKSVDERKAILASQVALLVNQGWMIETASLTSTVLARGRLLTWRQMVTVDDRGEVSLERFPPRRDQIIRVVGVGVILVIVLILIVVQAATSH